MGKKRETKPLIIKPGTENEEQQQVPTVKQSSSSSKTKGGGEEKSSSSSRKSVTSSSSSSPSSSSSSSSKKAPKGKIMSSITTRPKLASLHETSAEADDGRSSSREMEREEERKCLQDPRSRAGVGAGAGAGPTSNETDVDQVRSCPMYFGVRSYLHHFYETVNHPATPGTEEDFLYLIRPKGRNCGALWFKIGLIVGATLFLLGAIAIVIGYAIPKEDVIIGRNDEYEVVDKDAVRFNKNLDICKLIGLAGFCSGGLVLVISLLAPTFTSTYWEDDPATEPFRVSLSSSLIYEAEPKSPIPVTKPNFIQPIWAE